MMFFYAINFDERKMHMYEHERQVQIHKNEGFTVLSNGFIRDKNLSNRALGLLTFMLSLPPNWDYSIAGLTKVRKEGYEEITLFCFILVGGILGFLVFNANPAKIFMGDTRLISTWSNIRYDCYFIKT